MLSDEKLIRLMKGGESDHVEFTGAANDLDKFRQAICAFANDLSGNKRPGILFIGIDDKGKCANLPIDDALLSQLGGLRREGKIHCRGHEKPGIHGALRDGHTIGTSGTGSKRQSTA